MSETRDGAAPDPAADGGIFEHLTGWGSSLTVDEFDWMARASRDGDWEAYFKRARAAGSFSPTDPRDDDASLDRWTMGVQGAFALGLHERLRMSGSMKSTLESARAWIPEELWPTLLSNLLVDLAFGEAYKIDHAALNELTELGAKFTEEDVVRMAHAGSTERLAIAFDHGVDPSAWPEGHLPLVLEAITKDRAYGSSDRMACAKMIWERGGRFDAMFELPGAPSCLLELHVHNASRDFGAKTDLFSFPDPVPGRLVPLLEFDINANYFNESGLPPWAVIPPASDRAGRARLLAWLNAPEPDDDEEGGSLRTPIRARDLRAMAVHHDWLRSALEILELDQTPKPTGPAIARAPKSL